MDKTISKVRPIIALAMLAGSGSFAADVELSGSVGYATDARGTVVRNSTGLCWRATYWTPAMAVPACDPDLAPKARVESPPAPAPAAAPQPAPSAAPKPKNCNFSVTLLNDQTFAFNQATLTSQAKTRLDTDVLGGAARCAAVDVVVVTGHADRLGSQQYNQKLSERRAEAVVAYLQSKGLAAKSFETLGAGKTVPRKSCDDKLPRAQLIDCLAPNRRVDIDVKGPIK